MHCPVSSSQALEVRSYLLQLALLLFEQKDPVAYMIVRVIDHLSFRLNLRIFGFPYQLRHNTRLGTITAGGL